MIATSSRRMSIRERREFLATLHREGWLSATIDDVPRFIARRGDGIGYGYSREAAIEDLEGNDGN